MKLHQVRILRHVWILCIAELPASSTNAVSAQPISSPKQSVVRSSADAPGSPSREGRGGGAEWRKAVMQARRAISDGDFGAVERLLSNDESARTRSEREAWQIIHAELALARGDAAKAGLLAMRVVILNAESRETGRALCCAARAYEGLDRRAKAIELYEECVTHATTPKSTRALADERLSILRERNPAR